jgi:hypothetical protein
LVLGSRRVESIFGSANNCIHRELSSPRRGGGWPNGHEVSRSANLSGRTSVLYIMYYLSILEFPSRLFLFLSPNKWISGGHGIFSGASGIGEGLTIDLLQLNKVTVSADQTQTSDGLGNRWIDVDSALEPKGLAVIGGRVADIGEGGLTLGGGMSFFSGRYGWACDNVNAYKVCASQRVGNSLNSLGLRCLCRRIHS